MSSTTPAGDKPPDLSVGMPGGDIEGGPRAPEATRADAHAMGPPDPPSAAAGRYGAAGAGSPAGPYTATTQTPEKCGAAGLSGGNGGTTLRLGISSSARRARIAAGRRARPRVRLGLCAMAKKVDAKPMREILSRMSKRDIKVVRFGDEMILRRPVSEWPACDALISFFSRGFPLAKAEEYIALRRPMLVNDLKMEHVLRDRRAFYARLERHGIPTPRHLVVSRDDPSVEPDLQEFEDYIVVGGERMSKPFVEKPVNAEDHNVWIYYPRSMGGGTKRLFRKVKDQSSKFYKDENKIRRQGSYIYEEFQATGGNDIKVYCIGPDYAHAEGRKSPTLDGVVLRDADGKEVRLPVLLTPEEKNIARRVCLAFRQNVCGFDLLRAPSGESFVCDVNGWSFVKKSHKYYDDAAQILTNLILGAVAPERHRERMARVEARRKREPAPLMAPPVSEARPKEELRCVVAVIRHGDRTPKQKLKLKLQFPEVIQLHRKYSERPRDEVKLKTAAQLQEVLVTVRSLLDSMSRTAALSGAAAADSSGGVDRDEALEQLRGLRTILAVLEAGGRFSGINRKVQIKPLAWKPATGADLWSLEAADTASTSETAGDDGVGPTLERQRTLSYGWGREASSAAPASPRAVETPTHAAEVVTEVRLIVKWGGILTHAGYIQSEQLGRRFRESLYPDESMGHVRLHSTFRHDLKIYASDEGRVQVTAAAFAKGFLELEGELTPILASLVNHGKSTSDLLDNNTAALADMARVKTVLRTALAEPLPGSVEPKDEPAAAAGDSEGGSADAEADGTRSSRAAPMSSPSRLSITSRVSSFGSVSSAALADVDMSGSRSRDYLMRTIAPHGTASLVRALSHVRFRPRDALRRIARDVDVLVESLRLQLASSPAELQANPVCDTNTMWLALSRWDKLRRDFYNAKKDTFDLSKIPDIYDCAKYDTIHSQAFGVRCGWSLLSLARAMSDLVIPLEYGITTTDRQRIASAVCFRLCRKVGADLRSISEEQQGSSTSIATSNALWIGSGLQPVGGISSRRPSFPDVGADSSAAESEKPSSPSRLAASMAPPSADTDSMSDGLGAEADGAPPAAEEGGREERSSSAPDLRGSPDRDTPTGPGAADTAWSDIEVDSSGSDHEPDSASDAEDHDGAPKHAPTGSRTDLFISSAASGDFEEEPGTPGMDYHGDASDGTSSPRGGRSAAGAASVDESDEARHRRVGTDAMITLDSEALRSDLGYASLGGGSNRRVRTRLYFTSESHIHSFTNALRLFETEAGESLLPEEAIRLLAEIPELDYLSHVVFRMYENTQAPKDDPKRFRVEVLFSPGCDRSFVDAFGRDEEGGDGAIAGSAALSAHEADEPGDGHKHIDLHDRGAAFFQASTTRDDTYGSLSPRSLAAAQGATHDSALGAGGAGGDGDSGTAEAAEAGSFATASSFVDMQGFRRVAPEQPSITRDEFRRTHVVPPQDMRVLANNVRTNSLLEVLDSAARAGEGIANRARHASITSSSEGAEKAVDKVEATS